MRVYGVYKYGGEYEDYYIKLVRCFTEIKKAEEFMAQLVEEENRLRSYRDRCLNCSGSDRSCPRWLEAYDEAGYCQNWWDEVYCHEDEYYKIEDVELEE